MNDLMNKKRSLLLTILVIAAVFSVNSLTGGIFDSIADASLAGFFRRLSSVLFVMLGTMILRKAWIFRFDPDLLKKGWTAAIPLWILILFMLVSFLRQKPGFTAGPADIFFFVMEMLCVGFSEETLFRGLLQNAFHELFGEDTVGHVIFAVVCAGFCFGAVHLANAMKPGISLGDAAIQACVACGAGMLFGAVYFRTGKCLWYNVLIHAVYDAMAFLIEGGLNGADSTAVITQSSQKISTPMLIGQTVLFIVVTLFLLRKEKVEPLLG
jgi:hypothetical protein